MRVSETLRQGFVTGVVLIAPLAVTVFVVDLVYGWLVGSVAPLLAVVPGKPTPLAEAVALVALFGLITAVGVVVRQGIGDGVVWRFDQVMESIPVAGTIYTGARQASTALGGREEQFERVVLVRWPRDGLQTIGFITAETPPELRDAFPEDEPDEPHYDVFVPMVPNPMGGFLAVVPESQLTMTDLSVSQGVQLLVTTGMQGEDHFDVGAFQPAVDAG